MTLAEFAAWFATQRRECRFCTIDEEHLPMLAISTQVGHNLSRLGLDRLNGVKGYATDNVALCCFACNKVKSNTFSDEEMKAIGRSVAQTWVERLAKLGVAWQPRFADA